MMQVSLDEYDRKILAALVQNGALNYHISLLRAPSLQLDGQNLTA